RHSRRTDRTGGSQLRCGSRSLEPFGVNREQRTCTELPRPAPPREWTAENLPEANEISPGLCSVAQFNGSSEGAGAELTENRNFVLAQSKLPRPEGQDSGATVRLIQPKTPLRVHGRSMPPVLGAGGMQSGSAWKGTGRTGSRSTPLPEGSLPCHSRG